MDTARQFSEIERTFGLFQGRTLDGMCVNHGGSDIAVPE